MKTLVALSIAAVSFATARLAREAIPDTSREATDVPSAPSAQATPYVSLGYRELFADLMYARFRGYFGGGQARSGAMGDLAESIAAADPQFKRIYELGALAITSAKYDVDNASRLRAIALLEAGSRVFPDVWKFPKLAGQIYLVDLQTDDPKLRREWDHEGALLLETAARKPNAPADAAVSAAYFQSKLGRHEHAAKALREMLLITNDTRAREQIVEKLAELTEGSQDEIAAELLAARKSFDHERRTQRPAIPPSMYVLLGRPLPDSFDMADLATGGRDLRGAEVIERLEPLE